MKPIKTLLIVFLTSVIIGPILWVAVVITPSIILSKLGLEQPEQRSVSAVYSRKEFIELLNDKSPSEVLKLVGRPYEVNNQYGSIEGGDYWGEWSYFERTKDPIATSKDTLVRITFTHSRAADFSF